MKIRRKLLSILLTVIMVISLLPVATLPVLAATTRMVSTAEELNVALACAVDGDVIQLTNDITAGCPYSAPYQTMITIDGQGHKLTGTADYNFALEIYGTGSVILKNITLIGPQVDANNSYGLFVHESATVYSDGTVNAIGGVVYNYGAYHNSSGLYACDSASVDISTATGGDTIDLYSISAGVYAEGAAVVNVGIASGGANCGSYTYGVWNNGSGVINAEKAYGGKKALSSYGAYNTGVGTINVTEATGGSLFFPTGTDSVGVFNKGSGTICFDKAASAIASSYAVQNIGTNYIIGNEITVGIRKLDDPNTGISPDLVCQVELKKGTGTTCVFDTICVPSSWTGISNSIGRLPGVFKDGTLGKWFTSAALTTEFTGTIVSDATTFYSTFYPVIDLNDTTSMPDYVTYSIINNGYGVFTVTEAAPSAVTILDTGSGNNYNTIAVDAGVTGLTLILDGISILSTGNLVDKPALDIGSSASVTIVLEDDTINTLDASETENCAGISVPSGATVNITGSALGTGKLCAYGSGGAGIGGAGIRSGENNDGGTITISGGIIDAKSNNGAGIGGGYGGAGGTITINNGTIDAMSSMGGAGIGGGGGATSTGGGIGGTISIKGGTINAKSSSGAGIGGGGGTNGGDGGIITISGGKVTATSTLDSAGIGGGYGTASRGIGGSGGTITISGGEISAVCDLDGAGIGGGSGYTGGSGGTITISGGKVDATSVEGAGIGGAWGGYGGGSGTITISGGTISAKNDWVSSSIGSGGGPSGSGSSGPISISGGTVTAISNDAKVMSVAPTLTNGEFVSLASTNADGSTPEVYSAANIASYKYLVLIPGLSGTVTLTVNQSTGEVTATVSGGNTASAGALSYTWTGGASGTGTKATPTPGTAAICTVTGANYQGTIQASVTVYQVTVTKSGAMGTDNAYIANAYGQTGDITSIDYTLDGTGTQSNTLEYSGANNNPAGVSTNGSGTSTYTIDSSDADNGIIALLAAFSHTNLNYTASVDPTSKTFTAAEVGYSEQTTQEFTIKNTGTGNLTNLSAALTTGTNFEISTALSGDSIASGGTATVSVRPVTGLSEGTYTDTLTITGNNGITLSVSLSFTVNAATTYTASVDPTSKTFTAAEVGYSEQTTQEFTIKNTGTGNLTNLSAALTTGTNFEISTALSGDSITSGNTATVSVRPVTGLSAGTYTDTLTITGDNGIALTVSLSFAVSAATTYTATVDPTSKTFTAAEVGYSEQTAQVFTITNTGTGNLTNLNAALGNGSSSNFEISSALSGDSITSGNTATVSVRPVTGLSAGTYTDTLTITSNNGITLSVSLSFTVNAATTYTASVDPTSKTFTAAEVGYSEQTTQEFTIKNTGTGNLTNLSAALTTGTNFEISTALSGDSITSGNTATVSVRPVIGLSEGTYTDTITITGDNGITLSVSLSFTVNAATTYTATVDPTSKTFDAAEVGYSEQTAQVFTITNTGTGNLTNLSAALTTGTNFEISTALSGDSIASGGTATVSVRPVTGLSAGTYTDTLTITGDNGITLSVSLSFTVNAAAVTDAELTPDTGSFDIYAPGDVDTTITWHSASTVTGVYNGATALSSPNYYEVSGDTLTIKQAYLETQADGSVVLGVDFNVGSSATLTIDIEDTTPPTISPETATYDLNATGDVSTTITWYSASSVDAVMNGVSSLTLNTDYTVSGKVITIKESYLSGLSLSDGASISLEIEFDTGDTATLTVNIENSYTPSSDAALNYITVNGSNYSYSSGTYSCNVTLPYGTQAGSAAAAVYAVASDTLAQVAITQAADLPGSATIDVTAEDGVTVLTYTVVFTLDAAPGVAPVVSTTALPSGTVGTAYSQTLTATSDTPITWSYSGTLPDGLSLSASTGVISGTRRQHWEPLASRLRQRTARAAAHRL